MDRKQACLSEKTDTEVREKVTSAYSMSFLENEQSFVILWVQWSKQKRSQSTGSNLGGLWLTDKVNHPRGGGHWKAGGERGSLSFPFLSLSVCLCMCTCASVCMCVREYVCECVHVGVCVWWGWEVGYLRLNRRKAPDKSRLWIS